jgi:hypothetical protein
MIRNLFSISFIFILSIGACFGQNKNATIALSYYQKNQWDSAKYFIDKAIEEQSPDVTPINWYYAGFIYKEFYNNSSERKNKSSEIRTTSIKYLFTYLDKDSAQKTGESVKKSLKYLITTVYNDAVTSINPEEYQLAIDLFEEYKKDIIKLEPETDLKSIDVQFNQVLAQVFNTKYEQDRSANAAYFQKVQNTYDYIIKIEPNNLSANYNMGILYYNEAVHRIKDLDFVEDLITLELIQDSCVELFKKALPFMSKAYELNPKRPETLHGLSGIYFSLNIPDLSERYKKELELLEKEKSDIVKKKLSDNKFLFSVFLKVDEVNKEFGLELPLDDGPELIDLVKAFNPPLSNDAFTVASYELQIVKKSSEGIPQEITVNKN